MHPTDAHLTLQAKVVGALLKKARVNRHLNPEVIANALQISEEKYLAFESGITPPSLPELEMIAFLLHINPLALWHEDMIDICADEVELPMNAQAFIGLRQRMIAAKLRKRRLEKQIELHALAGKVAMDVDELEQVELAQRALSFPELLLLCHHLDLEVSDMLDEHSSIGRRLRTLRLLPGFLELPVELQTFVSKPVNRPFLELAMKLSELSVEKLRALAETLLEITY